MVKACTRALHTLSGAARPSIHTHNYSLEPHTRASRHPRSLTFSRSRSTAGGVPGGAFLSTSVMRPLPSMLPITCTTHTQGQTTSSHHGMVAPTQQSYSLGAHGAADRGLATWWPKPSVLAATRRTCSAAQRSAARCSAGVPHLTCMKQRSRSQTLCSRSRASGLMSRQSFSWYSAPQISRTLMVSSPSCSHAASGEVRSWGVQEAATAATPACTGALRLMLTAAGARCGTCILGTSENGRHRGGAYAPPPPPFSESLPP